MDAKLEGDQMRVEFSPPDINADDIQAVVAALQSGWITTGPRTKQFEQALARWCGTAKVACLNSATAAMECALRLLDVGPGDEVITSAYTYTASASVICHVGATPVLVDVAAGTYQMDPQALARVLSPRTKAIIPVDIGGVMENYDALLEVLNGLNHRRLYQPRSHTLQELFTRVPIVADAAHAFGATYHGQSSGAVADFSAFSFHAVKNLTTAEGGALTWRPGLGDAALDERLYHHLMLYSLHGQDKDALAKSAAGGWEYDVVAPLYKCNMTDINAALGLSQLQRYPALLARRQVLIDQYQQQLQAAAQRGG
ncbi:MAG: DegT/DnrJ/EryC1/StrS family aminotransferase, partial [Actinomycetia bacterium]|nr:DegT/DnrJ/EryC1/StrS family aminotransferase [Actinomycetes bacterium]